MDETIKLWDVTNGQPIVSLDHSGDVFTVTWSHDGTILASGGAPHDIYTYLWNGTTASLLQSFIGHSLTVASLAFNSDDSILASGCYDHTVSLWNPQTGQLLDTYDEGNLNIFSVEWSPSTTSVLAFGDGPSVTTWNTDTDKFTVLGSHDSEVYEVSYDPSGLYLATCDNAEVKIWDTVSESLLYTWNIQSVDSGNILHRLDWGPGDRIAVGTTSNNVHLLDANTGTVLHTYSEHTNGIKTVEWSVDKTKLVSGGTDTSLVMRTVPSGQDLSSDLYEFEDTVQVSAVAWHPDGIIVACSSTSNKLNMYNTETGELIRTFGGHSGLVKTLAWNSAGTILASGSWDSTVRIWDTVSNIHVNTYEDHDYDPINPNNNPVNVVVWYGDVIASCADDMMVITRDIVTTEVKNFAGHSQQVYSLAINHDGSRLASGGKDVEIIIWDYPTGLESHRFAIGEISYSLVWNLDSTQLICGTGSDILSLDPTTGMILHTYEGHFEQVNSLSLSHDGMYLVSGSSDYQVKTWNRDTHIEIQSFTKEYQVWSVAWNADRSKLAVGWGEHSEGAGSLAVSSTAMWFDVSPTIDNTTLIVGVCDFKFSGAGLDLFVNQSIQFLRVDINGEPYCTEYLGDAYIEQDHLHVSVQLDQPGIYTTSVQNFHTAITDSVWQNLSTALVVSCPAGSEAKKLHESDAYCEVCNKGYYSSAPGEACTYCLEEVNAAKTNCTLCPAGSESDLQGIKKS